MLITSRADLLTRCHELAATPRLRLGHLRELASSILLAPTLLTELQQLDPTRPYGRHVVYADETLEVMVATWTRGKPCAPHDHGGSYGAVRVLRGTAQHHVWRVSDGDLECIFDETATAGTVLACGPALVHSMGDAGDETPLMTLHLYTDAIDHMVVYDTEAGDTCIVEGSCGAWIPEPESGMLRKRKAGIHSRAELRAA